MEKTNDQKHFLAMQARPGDNAYIDVSKLRIANGYKPFSLAEIDSFTMCFTYDELVNSIKEANIVSSKYLNGKLVIADNQKHNPIQVITKDLYNDFDLVLFLCENIDNKNLMNTIYTKYSTLVKDVPLSKAFKSTNALNKAQMIAKLPYLEQRKFMLYLINQNNIILNKKNTDNLVRDKNI